MTDVGHLSGLDNDATKKVHEILKCTGSMSFFAVGGEPISPELDR